MPTAPYAKLRVAVNGGAPQTGGIIVPNGAQIALSAESTVGWAQPAARWEIYAFPDGWTGPGAPWTSEAVPQPNGSVALVYKYLGTSPPPAFLMPTLPLWGKFMLRLFVNGGIKSGAASAELNDQSTALEILSPRGLHDMAWREGSQFGGWRNWVAQHAANLRVIDAGLASASSAVQSVGGTGAITITGTATNPIVGIVPASDLVAGTLSSGFFTVLNTRTSAATASKLAERDGAGACAFTKITAPVLDSGASSDLELRRGGVQRVLFTSADVTFSEAMQAVSGNEKGVLIQASVNKNTGTANLLQLDMSAVLTGDGAHYVVCNRNGAFELSLSDGGLVKWGVATAPSLLQLSTVAATGNPFTITAQDAATTGGDIVLQGGNGAASKGGIRFRSDGTELAKIWHDGTSGTLDINAGSGSSFAIKTAASQALALQYQATKRIEINATGLGFFAAPPIAKPTVTGSRGGNAALASLLTALANLGLIINNSTP